TRLREGDFEVGDVIIATYEGPPGALTPVGSSGLRRDSLVVEAGKILHLTEPMGDLKLQGVLRFEIQDSIEGRVSRYFRNQVVRVSPLMRLKISGAAKSPGFYHFRTDIPLSDVIMRGGGSQSGGLN